MMKNKFNIGENVYYLGSHNIASGQINGILPKTEVRYKLPRGWIREDEMTDADRSDLRLMPNENKRFQIKVIGYRYVIGDEISLITFRKYKPLDHFYSIEEERLFRTKDELKKSL